MNALSWCSIAALALLAPTFYLVRRIPAYVALCAVIICAFAGATWHLMNRAEPSEWVVTTCGLVLCSFGLLIVRVMLIRSVSLQLLAEIAAGQPGNAGERLSGRPRDMRAFRLIRTSSEASALTAFGRMISAVVALLYSVFGVAK
jgi:hypothetical protein